MNAWGWSIILLIAAIGLTIAGFIIKEAMDDEKETTKRCPKCGNTNLILLRSLNFKFCSDCNTEIPWYLDKNQKPLK